MVGAFFDIDGTICRDSLLTEHFKKMIKYELIDSLEYEEKVRDTYMMWAERVGDYDGYLLRLTETYVNAMIGISVKDNDFVSDQVMKLKGNRVYKYTRDRIKWHKEQGHKVIFISGSPDWEWYNKVDTKLREFNERWCFMKRKSYDKQFKIAAVKLILEEEVPVSVVAKELEIHQNTLYRWVNEYEEHGESAFPGRGTALYSYQFEIKKLKKENLELKKELELLKKFRAFLKKKNI